jgi:hypothetical protein
VFIECLTAHLLLRLAVATSYCQRNVLDFKYMGSMLLTYLVRDILASGLLKQVSGLVGHLLVRAALLCWVDLAYTPGC